MFLLDRLALLFWSCVVRSLFVVAVHFTYTVCHFFWALQVIAACFLPSKCLLNVLPTWVARCKIMVCSMCSDLTSQRNVPMEKPTETLQTEYPCANIVSVRILPTLSSKRCRTLADVVEEASSLVGTIGACAILPELAREGKTLGGLGWWPLAFGQGHCTQISPKARSGQPVLVQWVAQGVAWCAPMHACSLLTAHLEVGRSRILEGAVRARIGRSLHRLFCGRASHRCIVCAVAGSAA